MQKFLRGIRSFHFYHFTLYSPKIITILYWRRLILAHRHPPEEGCNLLLFSSCYWKGAPTPWSRLPATTGRELQPPYLVYQPLLEGSSNPLIRTPNSICMKLLLPHWRLQPSEPLQTTFHKFSHWIQKLQLNTISRSTPISIYQYSSRIMRSL